MIADDARYSLPRSPGISSWRRSMRTKRDGDHTGDLKPQAGEHESGAPITRREWLQGAAVGALLPTHPITPSPYHLIRPSKGSATLQAGAAKRIITPNPLLPVSGGMGPTRPTREK